VGEVTVTTAKAEQRWWLSRTELLIVAGIFLFGVSASSLHELMFGEGLAGLPSMMLASSLGGLFWGLVVVGILRMWRFLRSSTNKKPSSSG
jgi:hypothetical protein